MKKFPVLFLMIWLLSGCSSKLDWHQTEDFEAHPVLTMDLFHTEIRGDHFYPNGVPLMEIHDTIPFKAFKEKHVKDGLQKMVYYFHVKNELPSSFKGTIEFLKGDNQVISSFEAIIQPGTPQNPFVHEFRYTIIKNNTPEIVLTENLAVSFQRRDSTDISSAPGLLKVNSKGDFYVVIQ